MIRLNRMLPLVCCDEIEYTIVDCFNTLTPPHPTSSHLIPPLLTYFASIDDDSLLPAY